MNIISMTGFGRSSKSNEHVAIDVEIKTVNSRYLDFNIKAPHEYAQHELTLRKEVSKVLKRGRVDIFISRQAIQTANYQLKFNDALFNEYCQLYDSVTSTLGKTPEHKIAFIKELLLKRDIVENTEELQGDESDETEKELLLSALHEALNKVSIMRQREGELLAKDLKTQLDILSGIQANISQKAQVTPVEFREKLLERLTRLDPNLSIDPQRLAAEVALFADRIDITEELVRLKSHLEQFVKTTQQTPNGRTLDFIIQECGRELNTITSKAQSSQIQILAVAGKACLEKIREQVQNFE